MVAAIDPVDLLAFMAAGTSMTSEQIAQRWPEWQAKKIEALRSYERDTSDYRKLHQSSSLTRTTDPLVGSMGEAIHHWVFLPLIQAALASSTADGAGTVADPVAWDPEVGSVAALARAKAGGA